MAFLQPSETTHLKRDGFSLTIIKRRGYTTMHWDYPEAKASGGFLIAHKTRYRLHEDDAEQADGRTALVLSADNDTEHTLVMPVTVVGEIYPMVKAVMDASIKPPRASWFPLLKMGLLVFMLSFAALVAVDIISTKMMMASGGCSSLQEKIMGLKEDTTPLPDFKSPIEGDRAESWVPPASSK